MYIPRIVITSGEPSGIGPDACVVLAQTGWDADLVVAADAGLLAATAHALGLPLAGLFALTALGTWQLDLSALVIDGLEKVDLVWDVVRVSPERLAAKAI